MYLFVVIAISVYTAMHLIAYWGLRPLLAHHPAVPGLVAGWMLIMILSPFGVRFLEGKGLEAAAQGLAWVGFTWMGFLFLAFSLFALVGVVELGLLVAVKFSSSLAGVRLHGPFTSAAGALVVLVAGLYGLHEANRLTVERVELTSAKLIPGEKITIAQISDLHLGLMLREEVLAPVVLKLKELKPDLIVATGDVVDAQINHIEELKELWREVEAPLGKYAVLGNHERYVGMSRSLQFLTDSGFTVLRDEAAQLGDRLTVAGIDYSRNGRPLEEAELLETLAPARFSLVLKHLPTVVPGAAGLFDLQLSGHTHRGQLFPFNFLVATRFPMIAGLYPMEGGGAVYTSRGTGTWGPPMRVGSPPELTLFTIRAETDGQ